METWATEIRNKKALLVMATPLESQGLLEKKNIPVIYTGIGKLEAAYSLHSAIGSLSLSERKSLRAVINLGTAGSLTWPIGTRVEVNTFVDRDVDLSLAGFKIGHWPGKQTNIIKSNLQITNFENGICGSGDHLEKFPAKTNCDLMDMEAYALAWVSEKFQIPFTSIKYITDHSNQNMASDWKNQLALASSALVEVLEIFSI